MKQIDPGLGEIQNLIENVCMRKVVLVHLFCQPLSAWHIGQPCHLASYNYHIVV